MEHIGKAQIIEYIESKTKGKKNKEGFQEVVTLTNMVRDLPFNKQTICSTLRRLSRKQKEIYGIKEDCFFKRGEKTQKRPDQKVIETRIKIRGWWIE